MFGYTLDDIPSGREWFPKAFPDSDYREMVISDWKAEFKKAQVGEVSPRTFRVTCKDGTVKVIDFRLVTLVTGDWLMFYEDITKRVQAEEGLVKSEEQYRVLVNQIPAVVYKGYADGRVVWPCGKKPKRISGSRSKIISTSWGGCLGKNMPP